MKTKPKILVVGSSNTDMIVKVPKIPSPGETILGGEFFVVQGGKGANQAVAAARAGGDVTFLTCLGNDSFGNQALKAYEKEGINSSHIKRVDDVATGVALINVSESGENSISVAPGANGRLLPEDIDAVQGVIESVSIILMQLEIPLQTVERVAELAFARNIPVILNPAPAQALPQSLLEKVYLLTPNEHEAKLLVNGESNINSGIENSVKSIQSKGISSIVVTLGEKGSYFASENDQGIVAGEKVKVIDTTAAGDTFNGYLAVSLAKGLSLRNSIQLANKAAAISVTRLGAQPSIPFIKDIDN